MPDKSAVAVASLVLLVVASAPAAAVSIGGYQLGGEDPRALETSTYGAEGHPSFIVELSNTSTSASALQEWANASESRTLISLDNASNTATVAAPSWSVNTGALSALASNPGETLSNPMALVNAFSAPKLSSESFVQAIHPNYQHSLTRPEALREADFQPPTEGVTALNDPAFPTEGIAFSDEANKSYPSDWRQTIEAQGVAANGTGITIGVIDTGANVLSGQIFGNGTSGSDIRVSNASKSFISNETVAEVGWDAIQDKNGHGSWTAAALAANPSGERFDAPASNASLLVLKALNSEGSGSTSDIAAAIRYAADHDVDVLSLSLGSPVYDQAIVDAIRYAKRNGVQAIGVAAGNTRAFSPGLGTPADVPSVISVGATNGSTNATRAASAYFSQYSGAQAADGNATNTEQVDIVAPGLKTTLKTATPDGYTVNKTLSGTSMSTPIAMSGLAEAMSANATLRDASLEAIHDNVTATAQPSRNLAVAEAGNGTISVSNLITGERPNQTQREAMDSAARQRQVFYEGLNTGGGLLARVL